MTNKSSKAKNPSFTLHCPITKNTVTANPREQLTMPDNRMKWWHCPECNGWHVSIAQDEIHSPATNQFYFEPTS
jgi:hypothetical protein